MLNLPRISVIVPFFNSEKYLAETIDSLMKQQMKDMEFIFVNDGSTDNSSEILKSKIENDKRFIVIDQENQGQSIARNTGLNAARGEYIFFLDSDDLLSDNYFEELYETAKSKDLDLVCTNTIFLINGEEKHSNFLNKYVIKASKAKNMYKEALCINKSSVVWGKLYKKSFLQTNGIVFKSFKRFEDNYFIFNVCLNEPKVGYCFNSTVYYRIRENSIMTSIDLSKKHYYDMIKIIDSIKELLDLSKAKREYYLIWEEMIVMDILNWGRKSMDADFISRLKNKISFKNIFCNPFITFKQKRKILALMLYLSFLKTYVKTSPV